MENETETIVLSGSPEAIQAVHDFIKRQDKTDSQLIQRKNLDGDTATWIVIATLANQALPHVLSFLKDLISGKNIEKFKVGDVEVTHPTPKIVEELLKEIKNRSNRPSADPNEVTAN
jgi:hypothetical protein